METITSTAKTLPEAAMFAKTILKSWDLQVNRLTDFFNSVNDEILARETATGRNSGIYLLGHLVAVNDGLFPLLGLGSKLYPELENAFVRSPDKSGLEYPSVEDLRKYWKDVSEKLTARFNAMAPAEWLSKHESVSSEDFLKEPHRNKLNVLVSRTTHMSYHLGQLIYLRERAA
ncbi:MAG: DinB family protein [Chryseolinea sp.]